jgi:hypothetical protein
VTAADDDGVVATHAQLKALPNAQSNVKDSSIGK